jgi:beta-phosphoglucomutase-like phosphatase (HAD superfamily)
LFDLDGVLTKTAKVHAAWKERFDGYLQERVTRTALQAFDAVAEHTTAAVGRVTMSERDHPLKASSGDAPAQRRSGDLLRGRPPPVRGRGCATNDALPAHPRSPPRLSRHI